MNPVRMLMKKVDSLRSARRDRRMGKDMAAMISTLPEDMDLHETIDFLFSPAAEAIAPWQIEEEFRKLIQLVANMRPKVMLEIGTADGGSLFAHARAAATDAFLVSIDLPDGPFGGGYPAWRVPLYQSFALPSQHGWHAAGISQSSRTPPSFVALPRPSGPHPRRRPGR